MILQVLLHRKPLAKGDPSWDVDTNERTSDGPDNTAEGDTLEIDVRKTLFIPLSGDHRSKKGAF